MHEEPRLGPLESSGAHRPQCWAVQAQITNIWGAMSARKPRASAEHGTMQRFVEGVE